MKDIKLSRRAFVKASSASLAALSLPTILSGRTNESPAAACVPGLAPAQPAPPDSIANAWEAGSADGQNGQAAAYDRQYRGIRFFHQPDQDRDHEIDQSQPGHAKKENGPQAYITAEW